ncbi:MAG: cupin domain-containing protein [Verrucomicrobiota bacterium]
MSEIMPRCFVSKGETRDEFNDWTFNEWLCEPALVDAQRLLMVRATMAPRCCHPFHVHPHREEIIHVVSGKAEQWVGEEYRILGPGEVAVIPAGVPHGTYNPFDETLVFHAILSPAILPEVETDAPDPHDVSEMEPWCSVRNGRVPCSIFREIR